MAPTVVAPMNRRGLRNQPLNKAQWSSSDAEPQAGSSTKSDVPNSSREVQSHSSQGADAGWKPPPNEGKGRRREPKQPIPFAQTAAPARTPLAAPAKTPLASEGKTRLNSKAGLFVPGCTGPPPPGGGLFVPGGTIPPPPTPLSREGSKVPIRCVIEGAFGSCLGGLSMVDTPSHTNVEVVVHAGRSDMRATPPNMSGMNWEINPEARSRALYTLTHAFNILGSHVKSIEPSVDGSQLCIKYSEASPDRMCWEFGQYGYCPRPSTCRWEHIAMDTFIITIVMQPPGFAASPMAMPCPAAEFPATAVPTGYVSASPMSPTFDQASGMMVFSVPVAMGPMLPSTNHFGGASPTCCMDKQAAPELLKNPLQLLQSCAGGQKSTPIAAAPWRTKNLALDPEQTSIAPGSGQNSTAAGSERSGSPSPESCKVASPCGTPVSSPRNPKLAALRANRLCWADLEDDDEW